MLRSEEEARDLIFYLDKIYCGNSSFTLEECYQGDFCVIGIINGEDICFEIDKNEGILLMYSTSSDCTFIEEIIPVITTYMNGIGPIAKYNSVDSETGEVMDTTIEWNDDFENRIYYLKENVPIFPFDIANLEILVETKEEKDKRLGFTALIPLYFPDGCLDDLIRLKEMSLTYNEADTFLAMKMLKQEYSRAKATSNFDSSKFNAAWSIIFERSLEFFSGKQEFTLENFDRIEYNMWNKKWEDYFTYNKRCEYIEARLNSEDVSLYRPEYANVLKFKPRGMRI